MINTWLGRGPRLITRCRTPVLSYSYESENDRTLDTMRVNADQYQLK